MGPVGPVAPAGAQVLVFMAVVGVLIALAFFARTQGPRTQGPRPQVQRTRGPTVILDPFGPSTPKTQGPSPVSPVSPASPVSRTERPGRLVPARLVTARLVPARLVPARLVQTWKTLDLGALAPIARTWREWNPGFAYTLFDDAACAALISDRFGARVASAYARIGPGAFRADLWRYCELYANGGVYVDIDTACLGAVYDVLDPSATLAVPVDLDPVNLFNAFVAAAPEHPVMRMCIDAVVENVKANKPQFGLGFSGPGLLGACVAAYLGAPYPTTFEARTVAGVQFLRFDAATEVVSNAHGAPLMQNKNGSRAIHEAYEAEAARASVVRYEMHGPLDPLAPPRARGSA